MKKINFFLILTLLWGGNSSQAVIPTGYYYLARGKNKAELKTTLHNISAPLYVLSYGSGVGATWQGFFKTDRNADSTVIDMYSNIVRKFDGYNAVKDMAIEHSFPKSWWGGYENMAYRDLFHLYPADGYTNGIKSNLPLGEVAGVPILDNGKTKIGKNGFETAYIDNCFEPADEYKGDFARSYLYVATIYENMNNLWNSPMLSNTVYPVFRTWAIDLLLKWHRQHPVSVKEISRNDSVFSIQGNRNPFIDHPELAEYIWGKDTTLAFTYPAETGAFLVAPRRMTKLDYGVVLVNSTKNLTAHIQGVNITSPVTLSMARSNSLFSVVNSSISPQEVSNGYDLQVTYAPQTVGENKDTLLIQGGGMTDAVKIPLRGAATSEFIVTEATETTPVGGKLHWLDDPYATDYKLSLYQGDVKAGNLMISGYYEGASNDKALELFNGTGTPVDLSNYSLKKQTNGMGGFIVTQKLSGILQNNQTFVVVYLSCANSALRAKANMFADSIAAFNGNDAVALYRDGVTVDIVGKLNGGADYEWGKDKILKRKAEITHPTMDFDLNEWNEYPYADIYRMGTHTMNLSATSNYLINDLSVGKATEYDVLNLDPLQRYTYKVTSYRSGAIVPSANTMQLKTEPLEIPTALDATNINGASFTANWEANPYASGYYLDVYQLKGASVSVTENFDNVGSNGKPLPAGWTGTASGNYTTAASSGLAPNSIGLKANGEWLQTPAYNDTITSLNFMYKFPGAATGSFLKVEALNNTGWNKIDSLDYKGSTATRYYPSYAFSPDKGYTAIKFTYYKSAGNLALDDVTLQHGVIHNKYLQENVYVVSNQYPVSGLNLSGEYYYRVRATKGAFVSGNSDPIKVNTLSTGLRNSTKLNYRIGAVNNGFVVYGLQGGEKIRVYSLTGGLMYHIVASSSSRFIPLNERGMYVLQIINKENTESYKLIR